MRRRNDHGSEQEQGRGTRGWRQNVTPEEARFIKEHEEGLSKTTAKYAKWVHATDEHADYDGQTLATQSHEVIKQWPLPNLPSARRTVDY